MREAAKETFLALSGWDSIPRVALKADASSRSYERLLGPRPAILMDAPPNTGESTETFVRVAKHLADIGIRVPEIIAADHDQGFLLMEDFGDGLVATITTEFPNRKPEIYRNIIDVLIHLSRQPLPVWAGATSPETLAQMVAPAFEYFIKDEAQKHAIHTALEAVLSKTLSNPQCLSLRDCHAENLLLLPDQTGINSIGVLDFQDAFACDPAYDVMSLLMDVRRPFDAHFEAQMLGYYIAQTGVDRDDFLARYHVLGFQRNFRILGRFEELAHVHGKANYRVFMPIVRDIVLHTLKHPHLVNVRSLVLPVIEGIG